MGPPGGDMEMWLTPKVRLRDFYSYILCQNFEKYFFLKMMWEDTQSENNFDIAHIRHIYEKIMEISIFCIFSREHTKQTFKSQNVDIKYIGHNSSKIRLDGNF